MTAQQALLMASLHDAYDLLVAFQETIANALEGDHPQSEALESWLLFYEQHIAESQRVA